VLVTAIVPLAQSVGVNRIVRGSAVTHVFGDPSVSPEKDLAHRRRVLETCLDAMAVAVDGPTAFEVEANN
jgi:glycine reductase